MNICSQYLKFAKINFMESTFENKNPSTQQFRMVFPKHLNSNGTFFGGEAMQWLDEVAFVFAACNSDLVPVPLRKPNLL